MYKIKLKLFLFSTIMFFVTSSVLAEKHISVEAETLDGFENPDSWVVKFSALRCTKWNKPTSMPPADSSSQGQNGTSNTQNGAGGANNTASPSPSPSPSPSSNPSQQNSNGNSANANGSQGSDDGSFTPSSEWIKWIKKDSYSADLQNSIVPFGIPKKDKASQTTVLGVKGCWEKPGYNWLAIEPKNTLYTPDRPIGLSIWAWGSHFNYDVYVVVKNAQGFYYSLYIGNLGYYGWRNLRVNFPNYVFPTNKHITDTKLQIVRIKLVGSPTEDSDGFYTYFDFMQIERDADAGVFDSDGLGLTKW